MPAVAPSPLHPLSNYSCKNSAPVRSFRGHKHLLHFVLLRLMHIAFLSHLYWTGPNVSKMPTMDSLLGPCPTCYLSVSLNPFISTSCLKFVCEPVSKFLESKESGCLKCGMVLDVLRHSTRVGSAIMQLMA